MVDLTVDDIINIHEVIQARFNVTIGIKDKGLLDSIAKRPNLTPYNHVPFPDIYAKCGSLIEAIIKWHPFIDGNKRTGLLTAYLYMYLNGYTLILPLNAVRFSVLVAKNEKNLDEIIAWVRRLSAKGSREHTYKLYRYFVLPLFKLLILTVFMHKNANKMLDEWLAFDIYPEYKVEQKKTVEFILNILMHGMKNVTKTGTKPFGQSSPGT